VGLGIWEEFGEFSDTRGIYIPRPVRMWWVTVAPGRSIQGAFPDPGSWTADIGAPDITTLFPVLNEPTSGQNSEPVTFPAGSQALVPVDDLPFLLARGFVVGEPEQSPYVARLQLPKSDGSSVLCGGLPFGESAF
jgi:hypothetical protein